MNRSRIAPPSNRWYLSLFAVIALLAGFAACSSAKVVPGNPAPEVITVERDSPKPSRGKPARAKEDAAKDEAEGAPAANDPERAFVCEIEVLVTKFEAYGPTQEEARARVQAACREKFENMHCTDEEDLRCRKTFY